MTRPQRLRNPQPVTRNATPARFPGLNGLRFFAAIAVVCSHVELLKGYNGFPNAYENVVVYEVGRLAVTFFFVLSGFLITWLLLEERRETGTIAVKKFYVRRILRIWPLYYATVLLAFFLFPHIAVLTMPKMAPAADVAKTFPLFALFLPQLALSLYPPVAFAEPAWSIGVEEQFYLLWPVLMKRMRSFVTLALVVIGVALAARYGALAIAKANRADAVRLRFWNEVIDYLYFTRIECMAIGGLFAWLHFARRERLLRFLYSRWTQTIVYTLTIWRMVTPGDKPIFSYGLYAIAFGMLILNVAGNERSLLRLRARPFEFLGNISFSIYMLHEPAIQLVLRVTGDRNAALYAGSLALTIAFATASYFFIERPFLRWKSRYEIVRTSRVSSQPP
ncbi:MAG TPA: acyltransferase [Thermoanaerobaculia bacterium]|nr:acyltransferase [Thermoanaerobaculia bacterium]